MYVELTVFNCSLLIITAFAVVVQFMQVLLATISH